MGDGANEKRNVEPFDGYSTVRTGGKGFKKMPGLSVENQFRGARSLRLLAGPPPLRARSLYTTTLAYYEDILFQGLRSTQHPFSTATHGCQNGYSHNCTIFPNQKV